MFQEQGHCAFHIEFHLSRGWSWVLSHKSLNSCPWYFFHSLQCVPEFVQMMSIYIYLYIIHVCVCACVFNFAGTLQWSPVLLLPSVCPESLRVMRTWVLWLTKNSFHTTCRQRSNRKSKFCQLKTLICGADGVLSAKDLISWPCGSSQWCVQMEFRPKNRRESPTRPRHEARNLSRIHPHTSHDLCATCEYRNGTSSMAKCNSSVSSTLIVLRARWSPSA